LRSAYIKSLLWLDKSDLSRARIGLPAGSRKRAFYATGFEKRTREPAVWAFLSCACIPLL
jgi:hypothetical protein